MYLVVPLPEQTRRAVTQEDTREPGQSQKPNQDSSTSRL